MQRSHRVSITGGVNIAEKLYDLNQGKESPENTDTGYVIVNADNVNDNY